MKKKLSVSFMVMAFFFAVCGMVHAEGAHKYIGVNKCAMCHKAEAKGNQYGQWLNTKHAKAYERLASPEAAETATKAGVAGNPQEAKECLICHETAFGAESELLDAGFKKEDGVQCEACHGAGGDYWTMGVMKDKNAAIAAGLIVPTADVCVKCHNEKSPNFKGFNFDEYVKQISHPRPK